MTDTRLAESFLTNPKVDSLTDAAYRVHVNAMVWSTGQHTDGQIPKRALRYLHPDGADETSIDQLVTTGLWEPIDDGNAWQIHDFLKHQTSAAQVERGREEARIRKQKQRERDASRRDVLRDGQRDSPRDGTRDDLGQARQGQDRTGSSEEGTTQLREAEPSTNGQDPWGTA